LTLKKKKASQTWWYTPVIIEFRSQEAEAAVLRILGQYGQNSETVSNNNNKQDRYGGSCLQSPATQEAEVRGLGEK
jgi:hypothetical protein